MALRRPPTRIELKADDVEEYDKVSKLSINGWVLYDAVLGMGLAVLFATI